MCLTTKTVSAIMFIYTQMSKQEPSFEDNACCRQLGDLLDPRLFKALCDPNRLALLVQLSRCGPSCTVSQAAECCPVNISVVSRHLAMLRDAGILDAQKRGKEVHYSVRYAELAATLRAIANAIEACCPPEGCGTREVKHDSART